MKSEAVSWGSISTSVGLGDSARERRDPDDVQTIDEKKMTHDHFMLALNPEDKEE